MKLSVTTVSFKTTVKEIKHFWKANASSWSSKETKRSKIIWRQAVNLNRLWTKFRREVTLRRIERNQVKVLC
jgi:hypothetical protein